MQNNKRLKKNLDHQQSETTRELIKAAQLGNSGAFEQLLEGRQRQLLSLAAGFAQDLDEAEDIYQEAMIGAFKALPTFRGNSEFSTWLYRIVVNSAHNYQRKFRNNIGRLFGKRGASGDQIKYDGHQSSELDAGSLADNPEAALYQAQLGRAITRALALLSRQEKIAFVLCHQQELKITQAAAVMQCSEGTVKQTLFRAREKMRNRLSEFTR